MLKSRGGVRRSPGRAFSLIEVVVALAIFAIAIGVMAQAVNNAMFASEVVQRDTENEQFFRFAVRQVLQIEERAEVESGGTFPLPKGGDISWQAELQDTDILDLFHLTVDMELREDAWGSAEDLEHYSESIYVWRPAWSHADDRRSLLQAKQETWER